MINYKLAARPFMRLGGLALFLLAMIAAVPASAQSSYEYNSDNSSVYSRYGIGTLPSRSNGFNTSMAGVGVALKSGKCINTANPASYSVVDSITFILDVGMTLDQNTISYNGRTKSTSLSKLSYANVAFRLYRNVGLSMGYMPLSSIGYDYMASSHVGWDANTSQEIRTSSTYFGTGGLHQVYVGVGYSPVRNLSFGVNLGYLWGEYNHAMTQSFTAGGAASTAYSPQTTLYQADMSTYSVDFGVQATIPVSKKETLDVGATVGLGHNMGNSANFYRYTTADTTHYTAKKAFDLPMTYAVGVAYTNGTRWKLAADFNLDAWGKCKMPLLNGDASDYRAAKGAYLNSMGVKLGAEYCPNSLSRKYSRRICYRMGAYYRSPYVKVNGADGPSEYGLTAGLSLPIAARSCVNVGFKWQHLKPSLSSMVSENTLSLTLGITFNEQWFSKIKIR